MQVLKWLIPGFLVFGLPACRTSSGPTEVPAPAPETIVIDPDEYDFFDASGQPAELQPFIASLADIDFVGFGEIHTHAVGSRVELEVLKGMAAQARPVALAMEFFEADHQPVLDQYLAGQIDEVQFREQTHRDKDYETTHRPLIEFSKAHGIPVIAANPPRRLVSAYRKLGGKDYAAYLGTLSEADRAFMPRASVPPHDAFEAKFMKTMGPKRGPAFYPSMCLWNDAMAESAADFRAEHPEHRILLLVGGFHVAEHLGTVTQFRNRRAGDSVRVLIMAVAEGPMAFSSEDRDQGDLVLKVRMPKPAN